MTKIPFIITIDTEGDNLWSKPRSISTNNSRYLFRFQELCEKYGLKPVYLTNWEMVNCRIFQELARDVIKRNTGEIGMHLHAWNSPPYYHLTNDDYNYHPFLLEYPESVMRQKIDTLTKKLEDVFQVPMESHRAGRWAINNTYLRLLKEASYKTDCSVTPGVNWTLNDIQYKRNNIDYSHHPEKAYFLHGEISKTNGADFLEVPMTIIRNPDYRIVRLMTNRTRLSRMILNRYHPELLWLRPNGRNLKYLIKTVDYVVDTKRDYAEFMLHSSELMPGGSNTFSNPKSIENLYVHLNVLFEHINGSFTGMSLGEYRKHLLRRSYLKSTAAPLQ